MQDLKSTILAIFQYGLRWPCPVSVALKNPSQEFKINFFLVANQSLERLEGKTKQKGPISFKGSIWLNTSVLRDVHMMIVRNAENFEKGRKLCVIFPSLKNIDRFPTVQNKHTEKNAHSVCVKCCKSSQPWTIMRKDWCSKSV